MSTREFCRPDPEELLRKIEAEEAQALRGRLKIFLGYAPRVGKSFRMFDEGRRRAERGQDVVVGADAAREQQGGGIAVVDAANLPEKPVAPKRFAMTAGGFGLGFVLGLILVLAFELRRLFTIQTTDDAKHYTGLPVLASIPELLTPSEALAIPSRQKLALAAGFAVAVVAVPTLAFVLRLTHVFDKLAQ